MGLAIWTEEDQRIHNSKKSALNLRAPRDLREKILTIKTKSYGNSAQLRATLREIKNLLDPTSKIQN